MKKGLYILLFIFSILPALSMAQVKISGIVKDSGGPLPGITVTEKGTKNVALTSGDGRFSLTLKGNSNLLVVSSIGYQSQEVKASAGRNIEVILQSSTQDLNDVIVVGFGTTKRITNTGSVSAIKGAEIRNVPTSTVQNALQGKLPGFIAQQRSGQPGRDASDFFIRGVSSLNPEGNKPLIIVDDMEYTYDQLSQINVNEIESVSILKDASTTAVYGIKGANGVLVVTTRRGTSGSPKINLRIESGLQSPSKKPNFLNAYETALLVNEAQTNDGIRNDFTQSDLDHFRTGDDPYGHPDINWYDKIFKPNSLQHNSNIDISGGGESIKYFISGGAFSQNGSLKSFHDDENEVNTNYYYRRYNLRSNLDVKATKTLDLRLDVTARFNKINSPNAGEIVSEIYDFSKIHPYSAPFLNPNGSYAYARDTKELLPTLNARLATSGYTMERRNDMNILFGGTQKLDAITKGLSFSGKVAYASVESNKREQRRGNPPVYLYNPDNDSYKLGGDTYTLGNYTLKANQGLYDSRVNFQANFNYVRAFGDHHVSSLLLYTRESFKEKLEFSRSESWIPRNFQGFTWRAGYDYKQKYLIDLTAARNGSDRFGADNRFGFFPAISVGYNISNEDFFKKQFKFVDLLKIRSSYGVVGSDAVLGGRYLYQQVYNPGTGYSFGESHKDYGTITEGDLGNPNVTWEKQRSFDVGIDMNLFSSKITFTVDYFNNIRYKQLFKASVPLILGIGVSPTNIARVRNSGFDGQLGYHNNIGNFNYNISGVLTYTKNKVLYKDEPAPAFPWLAQTGHSIGQPFGYTFIGYYKDQADIDASPKPSTGIPILPGDLKYKDLNNDGVIDQYDKSAIGKPNLPSTSFGLTLGGSYKGFSFNILFQGTTGYSFNLVGNGIEPFQSQFQPIHQQRWTPETAGSAKFPRLTTNPTTINSPASYLSDFWLIDATYLRLKTVELGYQIPDKALPFKVGNARVYLSGYNLLTWTNYSLYQQDPEVGSNAAGDAYLNQRVINLGLQIGF